MTPISLTEAREALDALAELAGVTAAPHVRVLSDFIDDAGYDRDYSYRLSALLERRNRED